MKTKTSILVSTIVIILSLFIPGVQICATFDPNRLRIIDNNEKTSSILVRGNVPIDKQGQFNPTLILREVQDLNSNDNTDIHKQKYKQIIVVSFLSDSQSDERSILNLQKKFVWNNNDNNSILKKDNDITTKTGKSVEEAFVSSVSGKFLHRPITGTWIAPPPISDIRSFRFLSKFINEMIWKLWKPDNGSWDLADELHTFLHKNFNTIIYIHCMRGIDRTGLVAGTYLTRFLNKSKEEVYQINYNIAHRPINWAATNALRWTIYYMEETKGGEREKLEGSTCV